MPSVPMGKSIKPQLVLLAGGGTAGHIEPALAVADEIKKIRADINCEFLGTDGALEALLVPKRGYSLHTIKKVVLPRSLDGEIFLFPFRLVVSTVQAIKALRGVDLLIGFGGYVSAPAYLAAYFKGVPIVIHEANAKPGWANRLGRVFAKLVAVNFETVRNVLSLLKDHIFENENYCKDINNSKYLQWISESRYNTIKINPPKIEFFLNDNTFYISKNIPKELLIFLLNKSFINWDFFILNYLSKFKSFKCV